MLASRKPAGFTLVELVITIVVIGLGLAGLVTAFATAVRGSADPVVNKQMVAIAEAMLEEITLKPFTDPGTAGSIPAAGCVRSAADDVGDYAGYVNRPVCDMDGTAAADLANYQVSVALTLNDPLGASTATRITVTVTNGDRSLALVGWRGNY